MPPRKRRAPQVDALEELRSKGPRPVYAVDGEVRILVDDFLKEVRKIVLSGGAADFNFDSFSGKEVSAQKAIDAAQTLPAFAPRRLVLVQEADSLLKDPEPWVNYLKDPNPTTVLVLVSQRFDGRTKAYQAFKKAKAVARFDKPHEREMPAKIEQRAQQIGLSIDGGAVRSLIDAVGTDLTAAYQALELLQLYVGPDSGEMVRAKDVSELLSVTREESIFALVDAIGSKDQVAVISGLHAMLVGQREPPLRMLGMIVRHYRHLSKTRGALDGGASRQEVQELLGLPPFLLNGILTQARRQPAQAFLKGLQAIQYTDRALKGGPLNNLRDMERLALALLQGESLPVGPKGPSKG